MHITGTPNPDVVVFDPGLGAETVDLGGGQDVVTVTGAPGQIRLTFTGAEVGDGSPRDGGNTAPRDGGLAVRLQREDAGGALTGAVSRFDDEGIVFFAGTNSGRTFDVRDLITGVERGALFDHVILGTAAGDTFAAQMPTGVYYIDGGAGDDVIVGNRNNDFLSGGSGDDVLLGGEGVDTLTGGAGNDVLFGGAGADLFEGSAGSDIFFGGAGSDRLTTSLAGSDTFHGGTDRDEVVVSGFAAGRQIRVTFDSSGVGDGGDAGGAPGVSIQQEDASGALVGPVTRMDDEDTVVIAGLVRGPTLDLRDASGQSIGDHFEVAILGSSGNDVLAARVPIRPHYFNGGLGDDNYTGGSANDTLIGGAGSDRLAGLDGADILRGGEGDDIAGGQSGNDDVFGDAGNDSLWGDDGNDFLVGGAGSDFLSGGAGADLLTGQDDDDGLFGGEGADVLFGDRGRDSLQGGEGDDTLRGGLGNDVMGGQAGADQLLGEEGDDHLWGDGGGDRLTGGEGADRFYFAAATDSGSGGVDRILDFNAAHGDRIDLGAIDANASVAGDQAFAVVSAFSNQAGQLVLGFDQTANLTTVRGDVNGDGVADFTLEIVGAVTADAFVL